MCRILIFGGTTEGRQLAQFCEEHRISAWVSVASLYGRDVLPDSEYLHVLVSRMDWQEMAEFIGDKKILLVIDATHPYAKEVTGNIKKACEQKNVPLFRCLRDGDAQEDTAQDGVFYVPTAEAAVQFLEHTAGNVFVTTGSKELSSFTALTDYENRVYARVLPSAEVVEQCRRLGISGRHLICMQGPFSEDLNTAMMRQAEACWMVTKETGKNGGYGEKLKAARAAGASVIVIRREKETEGLSLEEVKERLLVFSGSLQAVISEGSPTAATEPLQVALAGIGPGSAGQMTLDVLEKICRSHVLLGAPRMIESALKAVDRLELFFASGKQEKRGFNARPRAEAAYLPDEVIRFLEGYQEGGLVTVLFSGDTGFYSGTKKLARELRQRKIPFQILPGISSASYLAAQLGISWENAEFLTAHGRELDLGKLVRQLQTEQPPRWIFILLAGKEGAGELCRKLTDLGCGGFQAAVGERLSYEDEKIRRGTIQELSEIVTESLAILAVQAGAQELLSEIL